MSIYNVIIYCVYYKENDILRILAGEVIPVDGEIIKGETSVDQSIMTGESLPVDKTAGDSVFCGTINRFGSVDIRATKAGEDNESIQNEEAFPYEDDLPF